MANLTEALVLLKPTAEFVIYNDDLDSIVWHKIEGKVPTITEIEAAKIKVDEIKLAEDAMKIKAKNALLEKLGITEDEAKLLLA